MPGDPLKNWLHRCGWLSPGSLPSRPLGALLPTMAMAVLLLALGYESAQHTFSAQLDSTRQQLAGQATCANRLAQENQALEVRLAQAQLDARSRLSQDPADGSRPGPGTSLRTLHLGETLTLLEGRLSLTLQAILVAPRRALLRIKTPNHPESEAALRLNQDFALKAGRSS